MNKILLITAIILFSISCIYSATIDYKVNAYLENEELIWPPNKEAGDITIKGLFKEQAELEKIRDGDWYRYLYKITYNNLEVIKGSWSDPEISFLCRDTWPTEESGIMMKALIWPFRKNEYMIFEIKKIGNKNKIIGYKKVEKDS